MTGFFPAHPTLVLRGDPPVMVRRRVPQDLMGWPWVGQAEDSASRPRYTCLLGALIIQMDRLPRHLFSLSVGPPEMRQEGPQKIPQPTFIPFLRGGSQREEALTKEEAVALSSSSFNSPLRKYTQLSTFLCPGAAALGFC